MTALIARPLFPLYLLCAALLIGVLWLGRLVPPTLHLTVLNSNPCALPCIFGVVPGVTARDQLPDTFSRAPVSYLSYDATRRTYALRQNNPLPTILVLLNFGSADDMTVRSVQVYQTSPPPTLGTLSDLLLAGYQPSRVFADCQNAQQIVITLDNHPLFAQVALGKVFAPGAPVMLVGAGSDNAAVERALVAFDCAIEQDWRGFALLWKYFSAES